MTKDGYFLAIASLCAQRSKDPSTQCGAVIVDTQGRIVSTGYNGFPQCMADNPEHYNNREEKYSRIIHAEMNALLFAKRDLQGCTIYTSLLSCDRCAVHLIQAGVKRFVSPKPAAGHHWQKVFQNTRKYLAECGCECCEV